MKVQKLLNIAIGALSVLLIIIMVQLVYLYLSPAETLAQGPVKHSHPLVEGKEIPEMRDGGCIICHNNLP